MTKSRCLVTAVFVLSVVGCRSAAEKARCAAATGELKSWLQALDQEGFGEAPPGMPPGQRLAAVSVKGAGPESAPVVSLSGAMVLLDGAPVGSLKTAATADELREGLRKKRELWEHVNPGKRREVVPLHVALGTEIPWSDVAALADVAASAGVAALTFLFDGQTTLTEPTATLVPPYARALGSSAVDPSQRARILAEQGQGPEKHIFDRCPQVPSEMATLGGEAMDPSAKNARINELLPRTIEACECKVDLNEVKAMRWWQYGRYDGSPKIAFTITLAARGATGAHEIAAPGSLRWSEAHPRIVEASKKVGQAVTLVARPAP